MNGWIEPPPRQKGMGCFGKGCLLLVALLVLLVAAFFIGAYVGTSTKPRELPLATASEAEQQEVTTRWEQFKELSRVPPTESATQNPSADGATPGPATNRIELSAADINQLIAANRKSRGKASVTIENNIGHVQVSIPLDKVGFSGRYLNGEFTIPPPADGNPRNLQVTQMSLGGMPETVLKTLLGTRSVSSYLDEFVRQYNVTRLTIENNKAVIETAAPR
ncbi:MAG: hypothetical protein V7609_2798 [Verrucomicrobiota bacterium]